MLQFLMRKGYWNHLRNDGVAMRRVEEADACSEIDNLRSNVATGEPLVTPSSVVVVFESTMML